MSCQLGQLGGTAKGKGKQCHAGLLLNLGCRVEPTQWKRICSACSFGFANEDLKMPAARCRILSEHLGNFSPSRSFYVRWTVSTGAEILVADVKQYRLVGSADLVLVFTSEEDAIRMSSKLTGLRWLPEAGFALRSCAQSKTFCTCADLARCRRAHTRKSMLAPARTSTRCPTRSLCPRADCRPAGRPRTQLFERRRALVPAAHGRRGWCR